MMDEKDRFEGVKQRYQYALNALRAEVKILEEDMDITILLASLLTVARETARDSHMPACQYQVLLIDELAMLNQIRRIQEAQKK